MAGDDRLSALGDDILQRILHFVPSKEAASTSVLSRRWGSLWRSSGAVNLTVRLNEYESSDGYSYRDEAAIMSRRAAFDRAAQAALDAADAPLTTLTFRLDAAGNSTTSMFLRRSRGHWTTHRGETSRDVVVGDLVSHPAARRLEELGMEDAVPVIPFHEGEPVESVRDYPLALFPLPSYTLRVLDLTRFTPRSTSALPRLETLRLRRCTMRAEDLQALIDAAPKLATMHLESVFFKGTLGTVRLRCPTVTKIVLELCGVDGQRHTGTVSIQINAPKLRYFRYKGTERLLSLSPPAPDVVEVDLHFLHRYGYCRDQASQSDKDKTSALFWRFLRNFTGARAIKLKVNYLEDLAVGKAGKTNKWDDVTQRQLLCTFPNAVRLELEGVHHPTTIEAAAVAIGNLLHCCPDLRDLSLKIGAVQSSGFIYGPSFLEGKDRLDYDRSVHLFRRQRGLNLVFLELDDNTDKHDDELTDIPGLTGRSFTCLETSLTRVALQFRMDNPRCLGVQLVKFLTENAKVLKEICVDSGNRKLCEHRNLNVERWIAPTSSKGNLKRKDPAQGSWEFSKIPRNSLNSKTELRGLATSFRVIPLRR